MATPELCGFIIVNKPRGATSFSMVSLVRKLTGVRRVGHAGTLDPMASGVLPVAIGKATRLIEYLDDEPKRYLATVTLGAATDTYDGTGEIISTGDASAIARGQVETKLERFVGEIEQRPPVYSALKLAGKPLYRYAREGAEIDVSARAVRVHSITLRRFELGELEMEVVCGKGTYIRSIAHDLGEQLGCGAHLSALVRASSGGFGLDAAHTPDDLLALRAQERLEEAILAADRAVERRPAAILEHARISDLVTGRDLEFGGGSGAELCRAYSLEGEFVGVLESIGGGSWHPAKVLFRP